MSANDDIPIGELASYAAACLKLAFEAADRGIVLRDVEATLCEDGRTVLLLAPDEQRGDWFGASFMLAEKTDEDAFDAAKYGRGFNDRNA